MIAAASVLGNSLPDSGPSRRNQPLLAVGPLRLLIHHAERAAVRLVVVPLQVVRRLLHLGEVPPHAGLRPLPVDLASALNLPARCQQAVLDHPEGSATLRLQTRPGVQPLEGAPRTAGHTEPDIRRLPVPDQRLELLEPLPRGHVVA
eukprot:7782022-Alexandrium_andersonii.AAC.1